MENSIYNYCKINKLEYLLNEWDYEKNLKTPKEVTFGTDNKYWWICNKGHSWQAIFRDRVNGRGCPFCANKKVQVGYNDLASQYPKLAKEWNYKRNKFKPSDYVWGSSQKVWWICSKGHEWEAVIYKRVNGNNCPYCANKKVLKGYNDLLTLFPNIAKDWDYEKNALRPEDFTWGSNKVFWWKCSKGHSWKTSIINRTLRKSGCPKCSPSTSLPDISIYLALKKVFNFVEYKKLINGVEFDIFVNDLNLAIEYDGEYYHKDRRDTDGRKDLLAKKLGLDFIRIYEVKDLSVNNLRLDKNILYLQSKITKNYPLLCSNVLNYIFKKYNLTLPLYDFSNIEVEARNYRESKDLENSLAVKFPKIAAQWHPIKNGNLKPTSFPIKSNYKAWWVCELGHEWQTTIAHRTEGSGCPYCYRIKGQNRQKINLKQWCIENDRKDLLKQWDYDKNTFTPLDVTKGSDKLVWWKCDKCGFEWQKIIRNRTNYKTGCPNCSKKR